MKIYLRSLFFFLLTTIYGLCFKAKAQIGKLGGLEVEEVLEFFDSKPFEDFMLVYSGDTVAKYTQYGTEDYKLSLFDQGVATYVNGDTLVQIFYISEFETRKKLLLPDSQLVFREINRPGQTERVYLDTAGRERRKLMVTKDVWQDTRYLPGTARLVRTKWKEGFSWKYLSPDSNLIQEFDVDSNLVQLITNYKVGSALSISENYNWLKSEGRYRRSYNTEDSTYMFTKYYRPNDTLVNTSRTKNFEDSSYTFEVQTGGGDSSKAIETTHGNEYKLVQRNMNGLEKTISHQDGIYKLVLFDKQGQVVSRTYEEDNPTGVEERLEKRDTFYHYVAYKHGLQWENDTMDVLRFFSFERILYLNEDSVVIKEVEFNFKPYQWPEITVTTPDDTMVIPSDSSKNSEYSEYVFICPGPIIKNPWDKRDSIVVTGIKSDRVQHALQRIFDEKRMLFEFGIVLLPAYLLFDHRTSDLLFPGYNFEGALKEELVASLQKINREDFTVYRNGKKEKSPFALIKIDLVER